MVEWLGIGMSPSGKAPGFGPGIRGFESLHPSQDKMFILNALSWLFIFDNTLTQIYFLQNISFHLEFLINIKEYIF